MCFNAMYTENWLEAWLCEKCFIFGVSIYLLNYVSLANIYITIFPEVLVEISINFMSVPILLNYFIKLLFFEIWKIS